MPRHECTYELDPFGGDALRCAECGNEDGAFFVEPPFRETECKECGETFFGVEDQEDLCEDCLRQLGFHVEDENTHG